MANQQQEMDLFEQELKKQKPLSPEARALAVKLGVSEDAILKTRAEAKWVLSMTDFDNSNTQIRRSYSTRSIDDGRKT